MQIIRLNALSDNYIFLLYEITQNIAAVIDPAQAEPVLAQLDYLSAELVAIFNTHHHEDHIGGNQKLIEKYNCKLIAPKYDQNNVAGNATN